MAARAFEERIDGWRVSEGSRDGGKTGERYLVDRGKEKTMSEVNSRRKVRKSEAEREGRANEKAGGRQRERGDEYSWRVGLKKGGNRWMDTDTPAEGKAEIMVLCGHLIGPGQHGAPQRSSSVSHFLDYRVKGHPAQRQIIF